MTATDIQPNTINKDLSLVDDPVAGTLTIVALLTGGNRTYGNDGKLIASNSGQVRFEIVYDYVNDVELSNELDLRLDRHQRRLLRSGAHRLGLPLNVRGLT